jgi:hypothetical protein
MVKYIQATHKGKKLVGAEIGVWRGDNALDILQTLDVKTLFLIDPYLPYIDNDGLRVPLPDLKVAKRRLSRFADKIEWVLKSSSEAANLLPSSLDFVYIDGNHSYDFVKDDVEVYFPKLVQGGVLGGHDFSSDYQGVMLAVTDFVKERQTKLFIDPPDWWIVKGVNVSMDNKEMIEIVEGHLEPTIQAKWH